jgi:hypothetical protein
MDVGLEKKQREKKEKKKAVHNLCPKIFSLMEFMTDSTSLTLFSVPEPVAQSIRGSDCGSEVYRTKTK